MHRFSFSLAALTVALACAHAPPSPSTQIEHWADTHPEAAQELRGWVQNHRAAAKLFFEWDGKHPERSHEFVTWAVLNPAQPLEAFTVAHPGWPVFDRIMESHRPAAEAFMGWCRRHPNAAEALMSHPGGLQWAGHHLYQAYWEM